MLKLSKCKSLLKRRIPFKSKSVDKAAMEASTVYVEELPKDVSQVDLAKVFKQVGTIRHVSLPRFKDKQLKGFGFIEFAKSEEA